MDLPGAIYFSTLAALSISFVGFSSIAIAFLKATDSRLSDLHFALIRIFFLTGLAAMAFSLLPLLLRLLGLSEDAVWRVSSALGTINALGFVAINFRERKRVHKGPIPIQTLVNYIITIIIAVFMGLNATGLLFAPYVGPYALAVTWLLGSAAIIFVENLDIFLRQSPEQSEKPNDAD